MSKPRKSVGGDIFNVLRGILMGCADVVPGVSGGTVALVLSIYERLVTAISHFDLTLAGHLRNRRFNDASDHVDLRFLVSLAFGIGAGIIGMTTVMNSLLTNEVTRSMTLAAFFGLIAGSAVMVLTLIRARTKSHALACALSGAAGATFAFWLTTLENAARDPSYAYVFVCGSVAICAMILPGISGAMILLIMGVYIHLTEIPRNLMHGQHVTEGLLTVLVFGTGAAISLVLFSKFLRWLLARYHAGTMAALCGLMVGALPKLWPFQEDQTPHIEKLKYKRFEAVLPGAVDAQVITVALITIAAAGLVLTVDWCASRGKRAKDQTERTE